MNKHSPLPTINCLVNVITALPEIFREPLFTYLVTTSFYDRNQGTQVVDSKQHKYI